jgi:hypothetical protein
MQFHKSDFDQPFLEKKIQKMHNMKKHMNAYPHTLDHMMTSKFVANIHQIQEIEHDFSIKILISLSFSRRGR